MVISHLWFGFINVPICKLIQAILCDGLLKNAFNTKKCSSPDRQQSHKKKLHYQTSQFWITDNSEFSHRLLWQSTSNKTKGCQLTCSPKNHQQTSCRAWLRSLTRGFFLMQTLGLRFPSQLGKWHHWAPHSFPPLNSSQISIRNSLDGVQLCATWHLCSHNSTGKSPQSLSFPSMSPKGGIQIACQLCQILNCW